MIKTFLSHAKVLLISSLDHKSQEMQMELAKRDLLIYKQMVCELKMALKSQKKKKMHEAVQQEINAMEVLIIMLI